MGSSRNDGTAAGRCVCAWSTRSPVSAAPSTQRPSVAEVSSSRPDAPLPRDTPLVASFRLLEHSRPHRVAGRVVWSHAPEAEGGIGRASGMGIEFTDGTAAARVAKDLDALP